MVKHPVIRRFSDRVVFVGRAVYGQMRVVWRLLIRIVWFASRRLPQPQPTAGTRRWLPFGGLFTVAVGLYYASVFEWLHYFDQYLSLEALHLHGHLRGWAPGPESWYPPTAFVQYEAGVHRTGSTFWTHIMQLSARLPYFIGTVEGWSMDMLYHTEFFYIVAAIYFIA